MSAFFAALSVMSSIVFTYLAVTNNPMANQAVSFVLAILAMLFAIFVGVWRVGSILEARK